jgi:hypothetical protein
MKFFIYDIIHGIMEKIILTNGKKSYTISKKDAFRSIYLEGLINFEKHANNNILTELFLENIKSKQLKYLVKVLTYKVKIIKSRHKLFLSNFHITNNENIYINLNTSLNLGCLALRNNKINIQHILEDNYFILSQNVFLYGLSEIYFDTCKSKYDCVEKIGLEYPNNREIIFDKSVIKLMIQHKLLKFIKVLSYYEDGILYNRYKFKIPIWFSHECPNVITDKDIFTNPSKYLSNYFAIRLILEYKIKILCVMNNAKNIHLISDCYIINNHSINHCSMYLSKMSPELFIDTFNREVIKKQNNVIKSSILKLCSKIYIQSIFKTLILYIRLNTDVKIIEYTYSQLINDSVCLIPELNINNGNYAKYDIVNSYIRFELTFENSVPDEVEILYITKYIYHIIDGYLIKKYSLN